MEKYGKKPLRNARWRSLQSHDVCYDENTKIQGVPVTFGDIDYEHKQIHDGGTADYGLHERSMSGTINQSILDGRKITLRIPQMLR